MVKNKIKESHPTIEDTRALVVVVHREADRQNAPTFNHIYRVAAGIPKIDGAKAEEYGMTED